MRRMLAMLGIAALVAAAAGACEAQDPAATGEPEAVERTDDGGAAGEPAAPAPDAEADEPDESSEPEGGAEPEAEPDAAEPDGVPPDDAISDAATEPGPGLPGGAFSLDCINDLDCETDCAGGACAFGTCKFEAVEEGCLHVDEGLGFGLCIEPWEAHPHEPCLFCNPAIRQDGWTSVAQVAEFEDPSAPGLETLNLSGSLAAWQISEERAWKGEASLRFGAPAATTYDVDERAWGRAMTGTFPVVEGFTPLLSFALWLETEETPGYDVLTVIVSRDGGPAETAWSSDDIGGTTGGVFVPFLVPLEGFGGSEISVGFEFDTVDALINAFEGPYIDQVHLSMGCCAVPTDCKDASPCTVDLCPYFGESCKHKSVQGCCDIDGDCDDGDPCTKDICSGPGGACSYVPSAGCCETVAECADDDPCTEEACVEGLCKVTQICCQVRADCADGDKCTDEDCVDHECVYPNICCQTDNECDDFDLCTFDSCFDGDCIHTPSQKPGCCQKKADCDDGDSCTKDACDASVGICSHDSIEDCCHDVGDCEDSNAATQDDCVNGWCFHCGDGVCQPGEKCDTCTGDCGDCSGPNSCVGECGGSASNCYCDDLCTLFGDCCSDFCSVCGC